MVIAVMEYERVLRAPSPKIGCEEADLFKDGSITKGQLLPYAEAPTQEENPQGSDQFARSGGNFPFLSPWME